MHILNIPLKYQRLQIIVELQDSAKLIANIQEIIVFFCRILQFLHKFQGLFKCNIYFLKNETLQ